jgi:membrane associated rhomboid family serine protease
LKNYFFKKKGLEKASFLFRKCSTCAGKQQAEEIVQFGNRAHSVSRRTRGFYDKLPAFVYLCAFLLKNMQTDSFISDLKNTYRNGGMTIKLIFINVLVFIVIGILEVLAKILGGSGGNFINALIYNIFALHRNFGFFIVRPWGLFTSIFTHYSIIHLLFNLLFIYGVGRIFEQFFSGKRLLYTYILGGLFGGILEIIAALLFPNFGGTYVIGASGSVLAILVATAFYQPKLTVSVWGLFNIRLIYIALIFILSNLYSAGMGIQDGTAYFAHLGGALLGYLSVQNPFSYGNIINRGIRIGDYLTGFFKINTAKSGTFRYSKSTSHPTTTRFKTDEEYNVESRQRREKIDTILDKISKSGYESLSKAEKELLFKQSNK